MKLNAATTTSSPAFPRRTKLITLSPGSATGRDPLARRQIHVILLALKRDGKSVLISSLYLDEIEAVAVRGFILAADVVAVTGAGGGLLARLAPGEALWVPPGASRAVVSLEREAVD